MPDTDVRLLVHELLCEAWPVVKDRGPLTTKEVLVPSTGPMEAWVEDAHGRRYHLKVEREKGAYRVTVEEQADPPTWISIPLRQPDVDQPVAEIILGVDVVENSGQVRVRQTSEDYGDAPDQVAVLLIPERLTWVEVARDVRVPVTFDNDNDGD